MEVIQVEYTFTIKKNIFMHNHLLIVSDGKKNYEAIVESAPRKEETIIVWLEDFAFPENQVEIVKDAMINWFATQNIATIFNSRKGR